MDDEGPGGHGSWISIMKDKARARSVTEQLNKTHKTWYHYCHCCQYKERSVDLKDDQSRLTSRPGDKSTGTALVEGPGRGNPCIVNSKPC
jgi:hypothetical protein